MNHLKPNKIHLHLGLEKPVKILQLTDAHLSFADERNADMIPYAAARREGFFREANFPERDPVGYLEEALEYSKNFDCTVITGDLVDFNTFKNYETAEEILSGKDYMFCAGNHEFTPKPGTDSYERKAQTTDYIQSHFRSNIFFESRIVGGVNIVAMDNGYCLWTEEQFDFLKAQVAKGLPILLFCHLPVRETSLRWESYDDPSFASLGATEEMKQTCMKVTKYLADEPLFKGFFVGHMHGSGQITFVGKPCYILGALFKGIVGEITID